MNNAAELIVDRTEETNTEVQPKLLWWLSFADPYKPSGSQFLGVAILEVPMGTDPISYAHQTNCNPGGEVRFMPIEDDATQYPAKYRNRLLNREEAMIMGRAVKM